MGDFLSTPNKRKHSSEAENAIVKTTKNRFYIFVEMRHYEKITKSKTTLNFNSTAPLRHKLNTIVGAVHRINNSCTTITDRDKGLELLLDKLIKNNYPQSLFQSKINETLSNLDNQKVKEEPDKELFLSLAFTDRRCDTIGSKMRSCIKKFLPKFKLTIAWRCIRVDQKILPRLKPNIRDNPNPPGVIYRFVCPCNSSYIGESKKPLLERIHQHQQPSRKSSIRDHTDSCTIYKNSVISSVGRNAGKSDKFNFFKNLFTIIDRNIFNVFDRRNKECTCISLERPSINVQSNSEKFLTII